MPIREEFSWKGGGGGVSSGAQYPVTHILSNVYI